MEATDKPLQGASRATMAARLLLHSQAEEASTTLLCGDTRRTAGDELTACNSSPLDITIPRMATMPSSFDHLRGERLLRCFIYRRRLGLLKTAHIWTSEDFLYGSGEVAYGAAAGLESKVHSDPYELFQGETGHSIVDAAPRDCVKDVSDSDTTTRVGTAVPISVVSDKGETSGAVEESSSEFSRRRAVPVEKSTGSVHVSEERDSVEAVLRPFSSLRLQLAASAAATLEAAACSAATRASEGVYRGVSDTYGGGASHSDAAGGMSRVDRAAVDFRIGGRTDECPITTAWNDPANLRNEKPTIGGSHVLGTHTEAAASSLQSKWEGVNSDQSAKPRPAGIHRHQFFAPAKPESACTTSYVGGSESQEVHCEENKSGRPRSFTGVEEAATSAHVEPHYLLIEQQREAVATAEATAAMLRRRVRELQAENDSLLFRWYQGAEKSWHDESTLMFRIMNGRPRQNNAVGRCDSDSDRAVVVTANGCPNSVEARDEIQLLKQQLAICHREVHMLSQENDHLREMCSRQK